MIIELKWDKSTEGAINQIKENNYPKVLEPFEGNIILVGINYDTGSKVHTCEVNYYIHAV